MKPFRIVFMAMALALLFSGCVYIHTVEPLTLNMDRTPMTSVEKEGSLKLISFPPLSGAYQLVAWDSAAIGDVAKKQGMQEVYFADLETLSILRIWNRYTIHVYGK
jgi:PBP1b-binding outer membrane lipoprotein LpoB